MFGKVEYAQANELLNKKFNEKKVLIACHRGAWGGNVIENTRLSFQLSLDMGADMFECDIAQSTDGVLYAIHDGYEERFFGLKENIEKFSSKKIERLEYRNSLNHKSGVKVERLEEVIAYFNKGELYNIDRAWQKLGKTLAMLDKYPYTSQQALLKTPVDKVFLEKINQHETKYMYMPIVRNLSEIERVLSYPNINLIGMELIAPTLDSELFSKEIIDSLHEKKLFAWINSINLSISPAHVLFAGLDDQNGLSGGDAWGRLIDGGVDIIQTDWPLQLQRYRDKYLRINQKNARNM